MGTEVLRPQDTMAIGRFCETMTSFPRRRHLRNSPNLIVNRRPYHDVHKNYSKPDNRRREVSRKTPPSPPLHVTILRRGESLAKGGLFNNKSVSGDHIKKQTEHHKSMLRGCKSCDELPISGTGRMEPESPEMLPKQIKLLPSRDVYAGSAFSLSPSPRSLPLPSFFGNNNKVGSCYDDDDDDDVMFVDSATIGLRRLLGLD